MSDLIQIITFRQSSGTQCTPEAPQYAGVQGDNGRAQVCFILPTAYQSDSYLYRIEMVTGGGSLVTSELLTPKNGMVSLTLTRPFTEAGGRCTVRLIVTVTDENGDESTEFCALAGRLYFEDRPSEGVPAIKHGISEMLYGVAADAALAEQAAITATDAVSAAESAAQTAVTSGTAAAEAAEAAQLAAMQTDAVIERVSRTYAPVSTVSFTGSSLTANGCADAYLAGLEITGNTVHDKEPSIYDPANLLTSFSGTGALTLTNADGTQTVDLSSLALDKWDKLYLDSDGVWKIYRGTYTKVIGANSQVILSSEYNENYTRYLIGSAAFTTVRIRGEGITSHLPMIAKATSEGAMISTGGGLHVNVVLKTADFPDITYVQAWLDEQAAAGTPFTAKYPAEFPTTEILSDEWQTALGALKTTAGENALTVTFDTEPSAVTMKAVAAPSDKTVGLLASGGTHALTSADNCTAESSSGGLTLYSVGNTALLENLVFFRCACAQEQNGVLTAIIQYQCKDGALSAQTLTTASGAYLKSNAADVYLAIGN